MSIPFWRAASDWVTTCDNSEHAFPQLLLGFLSEHVSALFQNKITFIWRSGLSKKGKLWETSNQLNSYAFYIILDDDLSTPFCSSALPWTSLEKPPWAELQLDNESTRLVDRGELFVRAFFRKHAWHSKIWKITTESFQTHQTNLYKTHMWFVFFNRFARGDVEIALDHRRAGRGATSPAAAEPMEAATWFPKP